MQIPEDRIYKRYTVQGYNGATPDGMTLFDPCPVHVFAETEDEAIEKAKTLLKKQNYRVIEAGEYIYDKQLDGHK